jgi:hypothetical protein
MGATVSKPERSLDQALAAYASVTSGKSLDTDLVRARVLRSVRAPGRRSLRRYSFALPLAATLAASAAFAASQPSVRAAVAVRLEAMFGATPAAPHRQPLGRRGEAALVPSAPGPRSSPEASSLQEAPITIDELPLAAPAPAAELARPRPADETASSGDLADQADPQLEAYRAAHRTHFDAGNPHAALAAWDGYLADFPAGSFATDARFNRALCLVRLGRQAEARAALAPFASADPGSYRQAEASALLRSLPAPKSQGRK